MRGHAAAAGRLQGAQQARAACGASGARGAHDARRPRRAARTLLVLNLLLHILDGVRRLHLKGDGLAREGLHEDLHGCWWPCGVGDGGSSARVVRRGVSGEARARGRVARRQGVRGRGRAPERAQAAGEGARGGGGGGGEGAQKRPRWIVGCDRARPRMAPGRLRGSDACAGRRRGRLEASTRGGVRARNTAGPRDARDAVRRPAGPGEGRGGRDSGPDMPRSPGRGPARPRPRPSHGVGARAHVLRAFTRWWGSKWVVRGKLNWCGGGPGSDEIGARGGAEKAGSTFRATIASPARAPSAAAPRRRGRAAGRPGGRRAPLRGPAQVARRLSSARRRARLAPAWKRPDAAAARAPARGRADGPLLAPGGRGRPISAAGGAAAAGARATADCAQRAPGLPPGGRPLHAGRC
jgi:hypothetical protein